MTTPASPTNPPMADVAASPEIQSWLRRLTSEDVRLQNRVKLLIGALAGAVLLLVVVLAWVYLATVRDYAVLDEITVTRHPIQQGRLEIAFQVLSPGRVRYCRTCGDRTTELVDYFYDAGEVKRSWPWSYQPGKAIDLAIRYRGSLFGRTFTETFATPNRADAVFLLDTTGSMSPYMAQLKERCVVVARDLEKRSLKCRFALIGFGDAKEVDWLDKCDFTSDLDRFQASLDRLKRFDGGDPPESALDALEQALALPLAKDTVRYFYLATDAGYHQPTHSGLKATAIAARLEKAGVVLNVFSKPQFEADYKGLLGDSGRFLEIEHFGKVLGEGRMLED